MRTSNKITIELIDALKKPEFGKKIKVSDGDRLWLYYYSYGTKSFVFRYTYQKKREELSLGRYPLMSLSQARTKARDLRMILENDGNPKVDKSATFGKVFDEWYADTYPIENDNSINYKRMFGNHLRTDLGAIVITELSARDLERVLRGLNSAETAKRCRSMCETMLQWAKNQYELTQNVAYDLRGQLKKPKKTNFSAAITPETLQPIVRKIWNIQGRTSLSTRYALRTAVLLIVRTGDIRAARWEHFDFKAREWRFRASKRDNMVIIPLPAQVLRILHELEPKEEGFVFLGRGKLNPISDNTMLNSLRSCGVTKEQSSVHGFRSSLTTIMGQEGISEKALERCLTHTSEQKHYHRGDFLADRHIIMQKWANKIDQLVGG